jgi:hypothetical protein
MLLCNKKKRILAAFQQALRRLLPLSLNAFLAGKAAVQKIATGRADTKKRTTHKS